MTPEIGLEAGDDPRVCSEVGRLRRVIVHRPGLELTRLTPANVDGLLFDDVMWAKKAKEEHDVFAETLRGRGVELYFGQLLAEALHTAQGRTFVLDRVCTPELVGPTLVRPLRQLFDDLDASSLAGALIGGVLKADLRPLRAQACAGTCCAPTTSCCPHCPTTCTRRTARAGSTAGCR